MNRTIYLDNSATTRIAPATTNKIAMLMDEHYGNPSSIYDFSNVPRTEIHTTRKVISDILNCMQNEIYFTSGGTESDNWALKSIAENYMDKGKHIITSKIEHPAIKNTCKWLEKWGFDITYLDVDENGVVNLEQLESSIQDDTILISIMTANNEIGTIEPIKEIGEIAHKHCVLFHTDAVQAFLNIPIDVKEMNVDLLSASGHKFHASKGTGFLYVRNGVKMSPLIHGGRQENGLRGGTENVPAIASMRIACNYLYSDFQKNYDHKRYLQKYLKVNVCNTIKDVKVNCDIDDLRLPSVINFYIKGIEGESLVLLLSRYNICISSGSACSAGSLNPSDTLKAIGLTDEEAHSCIRVSISEITTKEDIDYFVDKLKETVEKLRSFR